MTDRPLTKSEEWALSLQDPLTPEVIWSRMAEGDTLKEICNSRRWPYSLVVRWKNETPERKARYDAALEDHGDALGQEVEAIARKSTVESLPVDKFQADTFLKLAGKLAKRYGDQSKVTMQNPDGTALFTVIERVIVDAGK
jgi:hypothetical protein